MDRPTTSYLIIIAEDPDDQMTTRNPIQVLDHLCRLGSGGMAFVAFTGGRVDYEAMRRIGKAFGAIDDLYRVSMATPEGE